LIPLLAVGFRNDMTSSVPFWIREFVLLRLLGPVYLRRVQQRLLARNPPWRVCRKGITRLCIEGFPRSANSLAVRLFCFANDVPVAHHTHSLNNVRLALAYGIPVLILVRNPLDAIVSACIYSKRSVGDVISSWISFYKYLEQVRDRVVLAHFDVVISNFNLTIVSVNKMFHTGFSLIEDLEAATERVFEDIRAGASRDGKGADKIPIPMPEREQAKAEYRLLVSQHPGIAGAQDLYDRLCGTMGSCD